MRSKVALWRWHTRRRSSSSVLPQRGQNELDAMSNDATNGYAEVNGLRMYYERHGDGPPLVVLYGALGTIEICFAGLLPELALRTARPS
jgi:hypothetical protein